MLALGASEQRDGPENIARTAASQSGDHKIRVHDRRYSLAEAIACGHRTFRGGIVILIGYQTHAEPRSVLIVLVPLKCCWSRAARLLFLINSGASRACAH
jgi:hypothetical protein